MLGGIQKQTKRWAIHAPSSWHKPQRSVWIGAQEIAETLGYLQYNRDGVQR